MPWASHSPSRTRSSCTKGSATAVTLIRSRRMWGLSASELAAGVRTRGFSAREVMEAHLDRIAAVNPHVNAIVTLDAEAALAAAGAADLAVPAAAMQGVSVEMNVH